MNSGRYVFFENLGDNLHYRSDSFPHSKFWGTRPLSIPWFTPLPFSRF